MKRPLPFACPSALRLIAWVGGLAVAAGLGAPARAADAVAVPTIYSCVDDKGNRLTSDRPIPECRSKEQRMLNRDGSLRTMVPPTLTAEERAERDAADRMATRGRAEQADAVRRDKNLLSRFPDEPAHRRAREEALDTVRRAMRATEARLRDLAAERRPLIEEAEFFKGKPVPLRLRQQLETNDATVEAQRSATVNQGAELVRISGLYDHELARLRKLWAGAAPGSIGPATSGTDMSAAVPNPAPNVSPNPSPAGARKPASATATLPAGMTVLPAAGAKN